MGNGRAFATKVFENIRPDTPEVMHDLKHEILAFIRLHVCDCNHAIMSHVSQSTMHDSKHEIAFLTTASLTMYDSK